MVHLEEVAWDDLGDWEKQARGVPCVTAGCDSGYQHEGPCCLVQFSENQGWNGRMTETATAEKKPQILSVRERLARAALDDPFPMKLMDRWPPWGEDVDEFAAYPDDVFYDIWEEPLVITLDSLPRFYCPKCQDDILYTSGHLQWELEVHRRWHDDKPTVPPKPTEMPPEVMKPVSGVIIHPDPQEEPGTILEELMEDVAHTAVRVVESSYYLVGSKDEDRLQILVDHDEWRHLRDQIVEWQEEWNRLAEEN